MTLKLPDIIQTLAKKVMGLSKLDLEKGGFGERFVRADCGGTTALS